MDKNGEIVALSPNMDLKLLMTKTESVAWSPDQTKLATAGSYRRVYVWELVESKPIAGTITVTRARLTITKTIMNTVTAVETIYTPWTGIKWLTRYSTITKLNTRTLYIPTTYTTTYIYPITHLKTITRIVASTKTLTTTKTLTKREIETITSKMYVSITKFRTLTHTHVLTVHETVRETKTLTLYHAVRTGINIYTLIVASIILAIGGACGMILRRGT